MKKHILTLIIGMLIGSIITTGVFLVLKKNDRQGMPNFSESGFKMREGSDGETDFPSNFRSRRNSNEENEEEQSN